MDTGAGCQHRAGVCWGAPWITRGGGAGRAGPGSAGQGHVPEWMSQGPGQQELQVTVRRGCCWGHRAHGKVGVGPGSACRVPGMVPSARYRGSPGAGGHSRVMVPHAARLPITGQWLVPGASAAPGAVTVPCACCPGNARFSVQGQGPGTAPVLVPAAPCLGPRGRLWCPMVGARQ